MQGQEQRNEGSKKGRMIGKEKEKKDGGKRGRMEEKKKGRKGERK